MRFTVAFLIGIMKKVKCRMDISSLLQVLYAYCFYPSINMDQLVLSTLSTREDFTLSLTSWLKLMSYGNKQKSMIGNLVN